MAQAVCMGAMMQCSFGKDKAPLIVLPKNKVKIHFFPMANVMDHIPILNIPPFGKCKSLLNPVVLAATIANKGVLKPMQCVPVTTSPWSPGSPKVKIRNKKALNNKCKLKCLWNGVIEIKAPGQVMVSIP